MRNGDPATITIVDYGLGNLFSVKHACEHAGLRVEISSVKSEILSADAVILPGVGAFGDAMESLKRLDLVGPIREFAHRGKPLIGVCLGMQLLMTESLEFGSNAGLEILKGQVLPFEDPQGPNGTLKVPQVGWNTVHRPEGQSDSPADDPWIETPMQGLRDGEFMYFVHSFYVKPSDRSVRLAVSRYGDVEFCSALKFRNVLAFQFHPERSGNAGLAMYESIAELVRGNQDHEDLPNAA